MKLNKQEISKYNSIHMWLYRHFGKASKCEHCGNCDGSRRYQWANISGEYKKDRDDFKELCQSCHKKRDHGDSCKRGHLYDLKNTVVRNDGNRQCRTCMRIADEKYKTKKRLKNEMDKSK